MTDILCLLGNPPLIHYLQVKLLLFFQLNQNLFFMLLGFSTTVVKISCDAVKSFTKMYGFCYYIDAK